VRKETYEYSCERKEKKNSGTDKKSNVREKMKLMINYSRKEPNGW
jgi:hypothetical protein